MSSIASDINLSPLTIGESYSPAEADSLKLNINKIAKDLPTQKILQRIFESGELRSVWESLNKGLIIETRITPLRKQDCDDRYKAPSSMIPDSINGKLSAIRIFYNCEMDERPAMLSLINEIMNASFAQEYLNIFKLVSENKITTKDVFASKIETLRWQAMNKSMAIIKELGLKEDVKATWKIYKNLELYLEEQKLNGHMEFYENYFLSFQRKKQNPHIARKIAASGQIKRVDVKTISRDLDTQKILESIFTSEKIRFHWEDACKSLSWPIRVIPLSREECLRRYSSPSSMQPQVNDGKLTTIRIFYDKEMEQTEAKIALIIEIMNACFARKYQSICESVSKGEIESKEKFALKVEKLEWLALKMSLPIIEELGLQEEIKDDREQFKKLDVYLTQQRAKGHTQLYEDKFVEYQTARNINTI